MRLQGISKSPIPKVLQLVALFLSIPCFKASNFCFKIAYTVNLRRMRFAGLDCAGLRIHDGALQLKNLRITLSRISDFSHRLRNLEGRFETGNAEADICDGNHIPSD